MLTQRWACISFELINDQNVFDSTLNAYIFERRNNEYNSNQNNVNDAQTKFSIKIAMNQANVIKRKKKISTYIEFVNSNCFKMIELKRYDDEIYSKYQNNRFKFVSYCFECFDENYTLMHRFYFKIKKFDIFTITWLIMQLIQWRNNKIRILFANIYISTSKFFVLFDRFMKIIIMFHIFILNRTMLQRYC